MVTSAHITEPGLERCEALRNRGELCKIRELMLQGSDFMEAGNLASGSWLLTRAPQKAPVVPEVCVRACVSMGCTHMCTL